MELLETQDPEKRRLIETSDRHRQELQKEVKAISDRTEKILTNALIVGGVLAITYLAVSQLGKSRKKKKAREAGEANDMEEEQTSATPSLMSQIGNKVLNQATHILLEIAKDKLLEYLESRKQKHENP